MAASTTYADTPLNLPPVTVDLSHDEAFVFDKIAGQCEKSSWHSSKRPDGTAVLEVRYSLLETNYDSSAHPDWRARDAFAMVGNVNLDLSGQSWLSLQVQGDGTQHGFQIIVIDDQNRARIFGNFTLVDPELRTYSCDLRSVNDSSNPSINLSKIRKLKIALVENNSFQIPHVGKVAIGNITFSNQRRDELLQKNRQWLGGIDLAAKTFEAAESEVVAAKMRKLDSDSGIALAVEHPQSKVYKALYRMLSRPGTNIVLAAARNEYESAQLLVIPTQKALRNVKVEWAKPLHQASGKVLGDGKPSIHPVGYVECTPTYHTFYEELGETPDPLLLPGPVEKIEAGEVQPFFITVYVPADASAGDYTGTVSVTADGCAPQEANVSLRVYGFNLPVSHHLSRQFYYWLGQTARWYGYIPASSTIWGNGDGYGVPLTLIKDHLDFFLRHRIDIANLTWTVPQNNKEYNAPLWPLRRNADGMGYDFRTFDEIVRFCLDRGMVEFSIGDSQIPLAEQPNVAEILKAVVQHLKENNQLQYAHYKLIDESSNAEKFNILKTQMAEFKTLLPELKTLATLAEVDKSVLGNINKVIFRCEDLSPEMAHLVTAKGMDVWWYWCAVPGAKPAPNYFVNYPGTDPRIIEWLNWKYQVKGTLYWGLNVWDKNKPGTDGKRWPEVPWNINSYANFNGDGQLVYPGPNGTLLSSLRIEAIRDGAEDYEYFYLLQDLIGRLEARQPKNTALIEACRQALAFDGVAESLHRYTEHAAVIQKARDHIAELILKANEACAAEPSLPNTMKNLNAR